MSSLQRNGARLTVVIWAALALAGCSSLQADKRPVERMPVALVSDRQNALYTEAGPNDRQDALLPNSITGQKTTTGSPPGAEGQDLARGAPVARLIDGKMVASPGFFAE